MKKQNILYSLLFLSFIALIFRNWFLVPQVIGGDWPYFFNETLRHYSLYFSAWYPFENNGLGGTSLSYPLGVFLGFNIFLSQAFHLAWPLIYKVAWFGLFIALSVFSSSYLLRTVLPRAKFWQQISAAMIFGTNTYILMVVSGGQMGVALSYAIAPLVLAGFINLIDCIITSKKNFQLSLLAGLVLAVQVMFDPRIAYVTMIGVVLYFTLNITKNILKDLKLIFFTFVVPVCLVILLHAIWILPILISKQNSFGVLGSAFVNVGIVKFLSFASFSQSLSILHPNWPENIFGKVYFMRPEFLLLPILAFSSLFFIFKIKDLKNKICMLLFTLLGLLGAFLAKGANPPFGDIYLWLFGNIPGFALFRDPTKFYLLITLSYAVLIPYSLSEISNKVSHIRYKVLSMKLNDFSYVVPIIFIVFWVISIHPAILGQLGGTFKNNDVPKEYVELKDFLSDQKEYFRTLWVPRQQRFSFVSENHPAIEAEPLFNTRNAEDLSKIISSKRGQSLLSEFSVKYILIPYDSLGEQFLSDRKYSEKIRIEFEKSLDTITWLKKIQRGKITVYETPFNRDHFFLDKMGKVSSAKVSPTHYLLTVLVDQPQNLIFSESFNPYWILTESQKTISAKKTKNGLNSFVLDRKGKYSVEISFSLEKYYQYGGIISLITAIVLAISLIKLQKKQSHS